MHIGFFNYYEIYNNNRMFKDASSPIGDDLSYPGVYLFKFAKTRNIRISTIDTEPLESYDAIVFIDFPTLKNKYFSQLISNKFKNVYLIIFESKVTKPNNWNVENHKYFKKIFTWNDEFVDNKKYFKINVSSKIPMDLDFDLNKKNKLCTLIAGHKFKSHPLELYTERVKAIRWFEQNHPEDFDLYGMGWDKYYFKGQLSRLNRFDTLTKLLSPEYPSYKGSVKSKRETMQKYKFAICYENAKDIPGYITEKIFDCFLAGCVPVYWGAPNVTEHIPVNTFVD
ncbi:MAG: glycosyltransferase family 10, partial [Candidatus Saelkia tenebricola]|nr:glycosyltransferase family 10 [Candidatus Saelkia tenebricola]